MGQEEAELATVVFSWEHEQGVSKQSPWTTAVEARDMPESPRKEPEPEPEDDQFLTAYLACTKSGKSGVLARAPKGQRRSTWAGIGLGLSCKSSNGVVEESMVRLAELPEVHPRDA